MCEVLRYEKFTSSLLRNMMATDRKLEYLSTKGVGTIFFRILKLLDERKVNIYSVSHLL